MKGQVVDATGKPLAGVWVNLTDRKSQEEIQIPVASQLSRSGQADDEGHFEIGPLKPGQFELEVDTYPREIRYRSRERTKLELPAVFPAPHDHDRRWFARAAAGAGGSARSL